MSPAPPSRKDRLLGAVVRPLQEFLRAEAASGVVLLACAVAALVWANAHAASYHALFDGPLLGSAGPAAGATAPLTARAIINDGLMAIFFFVVGMEIKRELASGELSSPARAALPAIGALGGMIVPALIYTAFNHGGPGARGWGIPMATDIAFTIGVLTLLGGRVPRALVVFVTALAIFDDIGGILVIAFFYGHGVKWPWLAAAAALLALLVLAGRTRVARAPVYALAGAALWWLFHESGIHATIAGVALGLAIPVRLVARFVRVLHPPVAFALMPLFALANSGVTIRGAGELASPVALGAAAGLLIGKPLGIFGLTWLAVKLRLAPMPGDAAAGQLLGVSIVAGIGFTVALFIAALAFDGAPALLDRAKLGVLAGSLVAGATGFVLLRARAAVPG